MTTFEPIDTADESKAVTTLFSKMFEFEPTITLPAIGMKMTEQKAVARDNVGTRNNCIVPNRAVLSDGHVADDGGTAAEREQENHKVGITGQAIPWSHKSPGGKNWSLASKRHYRAVTVH
jgi:hypothetical protein